MYRIKNLIGRRGSWVLTLAILTISATSMCCASAAWSLLHGVAVDMDKADLQSEVVQCMALCESMAGGTACRPAGWQVINVAPCTCGVVLGGAQ